MPYGMVEDVLVVVDSWEYPLDFMTVKIKSNIIGYLVILGNPWLAIVDVYIKCRIDKISILNDESTMNIIIYSPSKPESVENLLWVDQINNSNLLLMVLTLDQRSFI